jgi:hypothetical protein
VDVASWLRNLGLERYREAFLENAAGADVLPDLTSEDLKALGVAAIADRRRLLVAIAKLRDDSATPRVVRSADDPRASSRDQAPAPAPFKGDHLCVSQPGEWRNCCSITDPLNAMIMRYKR